MTLANQVITISAVVAMTGILSFMIWRERLQ